ncbi:MAG: flavodoxin [Methanobacteriaceae archaeon]|nr:flavodoxin [Methanobacteriaceae archaeon]
MNTIVLYYSRSEKTAKVADIIAKNISADIIRIKDMKDRSGPINYLKASIDALREDKTDIEPSNIDLSEYGLVYIGTPNWAGKPAPAIITLIDKNDFRGKDVILFATMGRQGGENVIDRMREKVEARGARMITSFLIKTGGKSSSELEETVKKTIEEMDLKIYGI